MQVSKINETSFTSVNQFRHKLHNGSNAIFKITSSKPSKVDAVDCVVLEGDKVEAGFGMKKAKGFTEQELNSFFDRVSASLNENFDFIKDFTKTLCLK